MKEEEEDEKVGEEREGDGREVHPTTPYIKNRDPVLLGVSWISMPLDS